MIKIKTKTTGGGGFNPVIVSRMYGKYIYRYGIRVNNRVLIIDKPIPVNIFRFVKDYLEYHHIKFDDVRINM